LLHDIGAIYFKVINIFIYSNLRNVAEVLHNLCKVSRTFVFAKGILWLDAKLIPKVNTFMILKLIFGRGYE